MTKLDVHFLARTAVVLGLLSGLTFLAHGVQVRRHARVQLEQADRAEKEGNPAEVVASLHRALSFDPGSKDARARYGLALSERAATEAQRSQALRVLRQALAAEPGRDDLAVAAARVALDLDDPAEASKLIAPVLKREPNRAELHELLARAQAATGTTQAALQSLVRALELEPARASSAVLLADLLSKSGQPRQADSVLDAQVKNNPRSTAALLARARYRATAGKLDLARGDLAQARKLAPDDTDVLSASAALAWRRGELDDCAAFWRALLERRPESVSATQALARVERERQRTAEASAAVRRGLERRPEQPELLFLLADLLLDEHKVAEAEAIRDRLARAPDAAHSAGKGRTLLLTGRLHAERRRWQDAIPAFAASARSGDLSAEEGSRLMRALARCQAEVGARDQQLASLRHAVELDATPSARLELARVLLAAGNGVEAVPLLRALAALAAPPAEALPLLGRSLLEANLARPPYQRDWSELESVLERAGRSPANAVAVAVLRSDTTFLRGDRAEARRILVEARHKHPGEPLLWNAEADLIQLDGQAFAETFLADADRELGDRIDWLLLRAERLARTDSPRDLKRLEEATTRLPPADCDRLERALAEACERRGNRAAVDRLCERILKRHPADLRARELLLESKLASGDDRGAAQLVDQMRKDEGADGTLWRSAAANWRLAQAAGGDRSGLAEAHKLLAELRQRRPGWSQVAFLEGRLADLEGKPAEALAAYRRALYAGDFRTHAVRRAVQLHADEGRYAEANEVLEVAQWHGALPADLLRPAARVALRAGKPDRACELARRAVPEGTRTWPDLLWLGQLYEAARRPTEAEGAFAEAVRAGRDVPSPWLAWLGFLARQDRVPEAEAALPDMSSSLAPALMPLSLAQAHEVLGQPDRAERAYRRILSREPRDAKALAGLLRLHLRADRPAEAQRVLNALLDSPGVAEEDLPVLRRQLALVLSSPRRRAPEVQRALRLLAGNRATWGDAAADRRVAALVWGAVPAQAAEALRALERLPGGPAVRPEETLRLARLYDSVGDWSRARDCLTGLLKEDGSNPAYLAALIDGLLRRGKKAEAAEWLERLTKLEPDAERTRELQRRMRQPAKRRS
jgi:predicted Zn-dependent protease